MTRAKSRLLNVLGLCLGLLLLTNFVFGQINERLALTVNRDQNYLEQARQSESLLDQLAKRIARGSDTSSELKTILIKRNLNVTLEINGETRHYP